MAGDLVVGIKFMSKTLELTLLSVLFSSAVQAAVAAAPPVVSDQRGCKALMIYSQDLPKSVTFDGSCENGLIAGQGVLTLTYEDGMRDQITGTFAQGLPADGPYKRLAANGDIFDGTRLNGQVAGHVRHSFPNGTAYEGEFLNGKPVGHGIYRHSRLTLEGTFEGAFGNAVGTLTFLPSAEDADGGNRLATEEGTFVAFKLEGPGRRTSTIGDSYRGNFVDGQMEGAGSIEFADGRRFEGNFHQNAEQGRGRASHPDGTVVEGEYRDNKLNGQARIDWPSHSWFEGEFRDDQIEGKGKVHLANGSEMKGTFHNGAMNGEGEITGAGFHSVGMFQDGKLNGFGRVNSLTTNWYAEGNFRNGRLDGPGVSRIPGQMSYEGDFKAGRYDGIGVMTIVGRSRYTGSFHDGKMDGNGVYRATNGNQYSGGFSAGRVNGEGTILFNGYRCSGRFREGDEEGLLRCESPEGQKFMGSFDTLQGKGKLIRQQLESANASMEAFMPIADSASTPTGAISTVR